MGPKFFTEILGDLRVTFDLYFDISVSTKDTALIFGQMQEQPKVHHIPN